MKTTCHICSKKLNIVQKIHGTCKCDLIFCSKHYPNGEGHNCTFNYIEENKKILRNNNPQINTNKGLQKIN